MDLHFFDPRAEYAVIERRLPHWTQPGVVCFITWRTSDSIPKKVLDCWRNDRQEWLRRHSINPLANDWRRQLQRLDQDLQREFYDTFSARWHDQLDASYGACVFQKPDLAKLVAESLLMFDSQRYELSDFIVMPNHVHLMAAFPDTAGMLQQCKSWKHFTAVKINQLIGQHGRFWQQDGFDHLVRSEEQFQHLRRYIENNGTKANLSVGQYLHYSLPL